jgi:hypothetical protein
LSGSRKIKDASGEAILRTESYAPFKDNVMPLGKGELKGIASDFDGAQLIPFEAADIFANNPTAVITLDKTSLTFGETTTNQMSAEQTYTVSATGLTGDLTISATGSFMIASTGDFGMSLTLSPSGGNVATTTIKVKFAPTQGSSGERTGEITHTATGAVKKTITLSGTEKGGLSRIAYTSFEEATSVDGVRYVDGGDPAADHDLVNNDGQPHVDHVKNGNEMGFNATYLASRGATAGLNESGNGNFVGVTTFATTVTAYTDGSKGYQMSDADGTMRVTFDEVDLTSYTTANVRLDVFVQSTGWELTPFEDFIHIYILLENGDKIDLLNTKGKDIDDDAALMAMEGKWNELKLDISGKGKVRLVVELDSDATSENIYLDKVEFFGGN